MVAHKRWHGELTRLELRIPEEFAQRFHRARGSLPFNQWATAVLLEACERAQAPPAPKIRPPQLVRPESRPPLPLSLR